MSSGVALETLIEKREQLLLAPYATFSRDSQGRRHPEAEHPYRGPYQRDRDRIVHCGAFRRLSGKMQVFTGNMGDYHRTRLTHTMEVASISRTIGRALQLNEDLIEALALLHDIGHPPFGHAGEAALTECLAPGERFSHNAFALTLVNEIERPYASFQGLNLTHEVLAGQELRAAKRSGRVARTLEAQVVDVADSIAYNAHDCDDAIKLNLLTLEQLREVPLVDRCAQAVLERGNLSLELLRRSVVHHLIDVQVADLLERTLPDLAGSRWRSAREAAESGYRLALSAELTAATRELEQFLYARVYRHPDLVRMRRDAHLRIEQVVACLADHPERLPEMFAARAAAGSARNAAVEYVATMTDRFFDQLHLQLFSQ